jgi:hypothetical protein
VDRTIHEIAQSPVHHPLRLEPRHALEAGRHNHDSEVATAALCAEVAGVELTVVRDLDVGRFEV